jgi:hypothetical protein
MKTLLNLWIARLPALLRGLGPYAAIELLLPGGSIIALLIWLYRHRGGVGASKSRHICCSQQFEFRTLIYPIPSNLTKSCEMAVLKCSRSKSRQLCHSRRWADRRYSI